MAENSKIEWTDHTFNPWWGCVKVSPGCKNCYASKGRGAPYWGVDAPRRFMADSTWKKPLKWNRKAKKEGVRHKVFCGSMCDVFEHHGNEDINKKMSFERQVLFGTIGATPNLDWLLLTKRPENVINIIRDEKPLWYIDGFGGYPDNVWIGTSIENQEQADKRIPELLKIPAKVRFLSCEPLLEEIYLRRIQYKGEVEIDSLTGDHGVLRPLTGKSKNKIDWVIVGGESGTKPRPFNPDWARSMRDDCFYTRTPFFMKQMNKPNGQEQPIPDDLLVREYPR